MQGTTATYDKCKAISEQVPTSSTEIVNRKEELQKALLGTEDEGIFLFSFLTHE
jgi:hypothetical protein